MIDIDDLIKNAIKSKNQAEIRAYKNLKTEIQTFKTAKNAKPYDEIIEIQIISKYIKKLESAISVFLDGDRDDLAAEYRDERDVLKKLLPEPVKESEIIKYLTTKAPTKFAFEFPNHSIGIKRNENWDWIPEIPKKEKGNVIKHLKSKFPAADSKIIVNIVNKYIV